MDEEELMNTIQVGELLYEYTVRTTSTTEYGVSLESLMAGHVALPPEGARFDVVRLKGHSADTRCEI